MDGDRNEFLQEPIVGLILAGGRSERMGGRDKFLELLAGRPILSHVIERLRPQVSELVISANGDPARFAPFGIPVISDAVPGYAGPLAGIHAGMQWVKWQVPGAERLATVAADSPFFPHDLVERLLAASRQSAGGTALAGSSEGIHPVFGVWPIGFEEELHRALRDGVRKVGSWAEAQGAVVVDFSPLSIGGRTIDPFFNINRPEQLKEAKRLAASGSA